MSTIVLLLDCTGVMVDACYVEFRAVVARYADLYFGTYYWLRVFAVSLIPCTLLVVLNSALARTMTVARRRRREMVTRRGGGAGVHDREWRRLGDVVAITMLLVPIVGVVLLVELPTAVLMIIMIVQNTWHFLLLPIAFSSSAAVFMNLAIVLSYPVNFFIFCGMSRKFRTTFAAMFACSGQPSATGVVNTPGGICSRASEPDALLPIGGAGRDGVELEATPPQPASSSLLCRQLQPPRQPGTTSDSTASRC